MLPLRVLVGTLTKPTPPFVDAAVLSTDVPLPVAEMAGCSARLLESVALALGDKPKIS